MLSAPNGVTPKAVSPIGGHGVGVGIHLSPSRNLSSSYFCLLVKTSWAPRMCLVAVPGAKCPLTVAAIEAHEWHRHLYASLEICWVEQPSTDRVFTRRQAVDGRGSQPASQAPGERPRCSHPLSWTQPGGMAAGGTPSDSLCTLAPPDVMGMWLGMDLGVRPLWHREICCQGGICVSHFVVMQPG